MSVSSEWRRPMAAIALGIAGVAAVVGCGGTVDSGKASGLQARLDSYCEKQTVDSSGQAAIKPDSKLKGDVSLWGWYDPPPKAVFKNFKRLYPNVNVTVSNFGLDEVPQKLENAVRAGTGAPDVSMIEDRRQPLFWDGGMLDLTKCLQPFRAQFPAFKMKKVTTPDGRLQAVPWDAGPVVLSYRRSIFEKYGIDPHAIRTWDDYIAAGKQLDQRSGGKVKMLFSNIQELKNRIAEPPAGVFQFLTQEAGGQWFADGAARSPSIPPRPSKRSRS